MVAASYGVETVVLTASKIHGSTTRVMTVFLDSLDIEAQERAAVLLTADHRAHALGGFRSVT